MKIKQVLTPNVISTSLKGGSKEEIIAELLDILIVANRIKDKDEVYRAVMERERKMSTGMQHGVAIPHAKTKAVKELVVAIGISSEGVDFNSFDGLPSKIFILTLSPIDRIGPHVQFLAEISMVLKSESARMRLLEAKTAEDVLSLFGV